MLSNSTLCSSPDDYGFRYWCSFCCKPSAKGKRLNAYRGILNGHGPQFGILHIVKIFREKRGSERLCDIEIQKTQKARQLCSQFSTEFGFTKEISFVPLLKAHMDETPIFRCSSDWKRPLRQDEWVLIEQRTGKSFKTFSKHDGTPGTGLRSRFTLNAFMHYTFHCTSGSLVVCGFEGSFEDGSYRLKSPVIHSVTESFGDTDKGLCGIMNVFRNHKCNALCEGLLKPNRSTFAEIMPNRTSVSNADSDELIYLNSDDSIDGYESSSGSLRMRNSLVPSAPPPYEV